MTDQSNPKIVIGIVTNEGKVLLVQRRYSEGNLSWQFPGGGLIESEEESDGVRREVLEETGIECQPVQCFGSRRHPSTGRDISYWRCDYTAGDARLGDPDDLQDVRWATSGEAFELITSGVYEPIAEFLKQL